MLLLFIAEVLIKKEMHFYFVFLFRLELFVLD